jgi:dienelactone hydrolase
VVVVHDAVGLSDDIREQADRLAAASHLTLAPDLYSGRGLRCVQATMAAYRSGGGGASHGDIEAARRWLSDRDDCTSRIGVLGDCMGGGFALISAVRSGIRRRLGENYGEVPKNASARLAGACPIVASFGARDRTLPVRVARPETWARRFPRPTTDITAPQNQPANRRRHGERPGLHGEASSRHAEGVRRRRPGGATAVSRRCPFPPSAKRSVVRRALAAPSGWTSG